MRRAIDCTGAICFGLWAIGMADFFDFFWWLR
jgi:hypothetical protein